ncbi:uncharacterized [Tachysurus ichikawai]
MSRVHIRHSNRSIRLLSQNLRVRMNAVEPVLLYSVSRAQLRIVFLCVRSELKRACRRRNGEEAHRSSVAAAARTRREAGGTGLLSLFSSYCTAVSRPP